MECAWLLMTQALDVTSRCKVLEVGTGSGYQAAVLSRLARRVYTVERHKSLARIAAQRLEALNITNAVVLHSDGTSGLVDQAPFDRIMVTAGAPRAPKALLDQLAIGGRLLLPEGGRDTQRLVMYEKGESGYRRQEGEPVIFVPLIGRDGWQGGES